MDVTILNTNLDAVSIVDTYESFIWTDRYYAYGDFELYEAMREGLLDYIKQDYYLQSKESEHVMIVEKIQITSDTEDGNHVTVTGRSLESILDRRIVWGQKLLSGNLQNGIKTLLNENVISPSDSNRKIPNFIFKESTDPAITKLKLEAQYTGDNLYDVIQKICEEQGIGFKITLNDEKQFVFELYAGSDRSYDQTENPYVIFSPKFENIINSNYIESKASLKTVTLVGGEGEGADRRYTTVGGGSGLNRRELFTDARDISSNVGSDDALTDAEYMAQLQQVIGIYYPYPIDNYVKYVRQQKFYGRYMDDWYIMNPSKEELEDLLENVCKIAAELGIHINRKKTRIVKISSKYKFLQIKYTLTDTGKVIKRINPDRVTAMRRKLKKLAVKVGNEEADYDNVENMFRGWMGGHYKLLSREQRKNLIQLYEDLFSKKITIVNKKLIVSDRSA